MRWWEKYLAKSPRINPLVNLKTNLGKLIWNLNIVFKGILKKKGNLVSLVIRLIPAII